MEQVRVASPEVFILQITALESSVEALKAENAALQARCTELDAQLKYERSLREAAAVPAPEVHKSRKQREVTEETHSYSEFKSNGQRKAKPADSIRSYDDFKAIQDYFLGRGEIRNWAMWTIGVCLGFRVSDLLSLRYDDVLMPGTRTFRERVGVYEHKTGKLNNALLTEAVRETLGRYFESLHWRFRPDEYLFPSAKTGGRMREECGWRILATAGRALNLPLNVGSHTMRKSFANIAACVDRSVIDAQSITKVQGLLNHSNQQSTMRYLGTYASMFDRARIAVSDFVLGKTDVNALVAGDRYSVDDIMAKIELLSEQLGKEQHDDCAECDPV